jgi:FkbH-like protein
LPGSNVLDSRAAARGQVAVTEFVNGVRHLDAIASNVVTVDWDWHAQSIGWATLRDERLWYLGRMRLNLTGLAILAQMIAGHVGVVRGGARKVAVVDLDNTLWGGIVGEVGIEGLALGNEGVGLAFQDFQRELLKWHDSGILLALCSKNNPEDALEVLDKHPGGILRSEHFVAMRINWQDKAENLRAIARELNLSLDSFVFLDDNPVEREWVARALPEVLVPELPKDPVDRPSFLRGASYIQRIDVTSTDRSRSRSYRAANLRAQTRANAASFEGFLDSLEQELEIARLNSGSLARAAQMCQRTNQFNLTTRRYTVGDLEHLMADRNASVFTVAVRDRFEDSGIAGLAILRYRGDRAEIDTFLLSCRVLGRKIEEAFLAFLVESARQGGASFLIGHYVPTAKNKQVESFFPNHGFRTVEEGAFCLNLRAQDRLPVVPPQIRFKSPLRDEE